MNRIRHKEKTNFPSEGYPLVRPSHNMAYIPTLDGWRAMAILGVILFHAGDFLFSERGLLPNSKFKELAYMGREGVFLFFGISGFLITARLLGSFESSGRIALGNFYLNRAFRILPPAFVYLLVLFFLRIPFLLPVPVSDILAAVFFYRNYVPLSWYTGHFWSLSVEEHFYLLWPVLFILLMKNKRRVFIVVLLALTVAVWRSLDLRFHFLHSIFPNELRPFSSDLCFDSLLWGCWAALIRQRLVSSQFFSKMLGSKVWYLLIPLGLANTIWLPHLNLLWRAIVIPIILLGTVLYPNRGLSKCLELQPLRWIGRISYSIYIWQQLFLCKEFPETFILPFSPYRHPFLCITAVFICASLSYYFIEKPMMKVGHRLSRTPYFDRSVSRRI